MFSAQRVITWAFHILFFFTPLFFTPFNNELFEYNKMMLVYGLTIIIVAAWLIKVISLNKTAILNRTPLDIPIALFCVSQVLSTIFSIDPHTSFWGYYSRSNGGLLSITSYILLYYAFVSNFSSADVARFLKSALLGGAVVSLYAIPEHFGISPSCIILTKEFSASCWVQDVQARVFATLGQPNWLGAYLILLIFPAIYFFIQAKTRPSKFIYYFLVVIFYLAFTFTYSRAATLGLLGGLGVLILFGLLTDLRKKTLGAHSVAKPFLVIILTFFTINLVFGSAITRFKLFIQSQPPAKQVAVPTTQLETGGTESGQIRLIVWKGALDIFKAYPILGSGVETFAYSYYNFRPADHNLVSEWDYLYNKAHNEYLNYLATTGFIGFTAYLTVILAFIIWSIKYYVSGLKQKNHNISNSILTTSLLAAYTSYLIQNFFGFSVVVIAVFFFLIPAFSFTMSESVKPFYLSKNVFLLINKRRAYPQVLSFFIAIIAISLLYTIARLWAADSFYKKGSDSMELGNAGKAYNNLVMATKLNGDEPLYHSDLGFAAATASIALSQEDSTTSARLSAEAVIETEKALKKSPRNVSLHRSAIRTYYQLASVDKVFEGKTIEALNLTIALAPTDAKLYYNKGLVLSQFGRTKESVIPLEKTVFLKPDYPEAYSALGLVYQELGERDRAIKALETAIKLDPNDPEATKALQELQSKK